MQFVQDSDGNKSHLLLNRFGVPQGSKIGPLAFCIYIMQIADLPLKGKIILYADDITLVYSNELSKIEEDMNADLTCINEFIANMHLKLNERKTNYIIFNGAKSYDAICIKSNSTIIEEVKSIKLLGVTFSHNYSFQEHITDVHVKMSKRISYLTRLRHSLPVETLKSIYSSTIAPLFEYCSNIWSFEYDTHIEKLVKLQKKAARVILGKKQDEHSEPLFKQLNWMPLKSRWLFISTSYIQKCILQDCPKLLQNAFTCRSSQRNHTRTSEERRLIEPRIYRNFFGHSVFGNGISAYNKLPSHIRDSNILKDFKTTLYKYLMT